jgi:hypothetical protein
MNAGAAGGLVLPERRRGAIPWALLGFILLSAFVHAFGFFLFQIVYPGASRMSPPPAQVSLLAPGTPEADAILRWINSEDPALAAEPGHAPIPGLMNLPYIPSYSTVHARPEMPAPADSPLPFPDGASGWDLVQMAAAHPAAHRAAAASAPTTLAFSGPLEGAAPDFLPAIDGLCEADAGELQPARFLIAVSDKGEVRYVFLQDSSGDRTLDAGAGQALTRVRFHPSSKPLEWGFATFFWGSSAYAKPPAPAEDTP